jgi:hypothetical protein
VISQGISPGEQIVTDGQLRIVPGAKVEIKNAKTEETRTEKDDRGDAETRSKENSKNKTPQ